MHNGDVLGDEGRKALNACVKVKIYGKPETRRYDRQAALERLRGCLYNPHELFGSSRTSSCAWVGYMLTARMEFLDELLLPTAVKSGEPKTTRAYNIIDIHDALVKFEKRSYVEKYPTEGPGSDKLRDLIDKRRDDIQKELEEAKANPDGRQKYSWLVAQRRVRDCFAGNFPKDDVTLLPLYQMLGRHVSNKMKLLYTICDIHEALVYWDEVSKEAEVQRAAVEKEFEEAKSAAAANTSVQQTLQKYHRSEAESRVRSCIPSGELYKHVVYIKLDERKEYNYNILDIHKAVVRENNLLQKFPDKGPGSEELNKMIEENRSNLEEEYQKASIAMLKNKPLHEYSWSEAERRVRDCFAGTFWGDQTKIFPNIEKDEHDQTYDIFDIKDAIDRFEAKPTLGELCKYNNEESSERMHARAQEVDERRECVQIEYDQATKSTEIEHGSGFIVHDHFIITNKHVVETFLNKPESHKICISNEAVSELPCEVIHYDPGKDLALLYCPVLELKQSGICPLRLSSHPLLPGMSIFSFGYPMSYTGETALFVCGNVSGSQKKWGSHSMVVLNCALNAGNSGGPVMCWVNGQLRVVGVATQKHFKEILTSEERMKIEKIRESLQTFAISDLPDWMINSVYPAGFLTSFTNVESPLFVLTLKLYDALETHSQFNLGNALPGHLVIQFIKDTVSECTGECKAELEEIVKLSEDPVVCKGN